MKLILSIYTFIFILNANSQENNLRWGINLNADAPLIYTTYTQFRYPVSLFVTISSGNHQIELGPQVYLGQYRPGYKLGLATDYKYYPNGFLNRFNTYFTATLILQNGKEERASWTYDKDSQTSVLGREIIKINNAMIGAGYGIELKISEKLYLGSDFQFLFGYGKIKSVKNYTINPALNKSLNYYQLSIYPHFGLNLGYRF